MTALPEAFIKRMGQQLGEEFPAFLQEMEKPPLRGIRMNRLKPFDGMDFYTRLEKIPWTEGGYYLPYSSKAGATVFHEAGAFYLQEPSAMLPGEMMDVRPGETILDLCAAPGGKSTQMGLKMNGEGLLVCNEPVLKRAQILSRNVERLGITNCIVTSTFPENIPHTWDGAFDGVLVDAPCSGEGMFRRNPDAVSEWSPEITSGCAKRQKEILQEASRLVRPGGRLVYSTCTFHPEENEQMIGHFLSEHPEFEPETIPIPGARVENGMILCLPDRMKGEGQFAARLRKKGYPDLTRLGIPFPPVAPDELMLMRQMFPFLPEPNIRFGNCLTRIPKCPDMQKIRVLRAGLHLAEIRGKTAVPDHGAALCILNGAVSEENISPETAARYMAGEEIPGDTKGWVLITCRNLHLGWGKGSNGMIKNHYPKALRKEKLITVPD